MTVAKAAKLLGFDNQEVRAGEGILAKGEWKLGWNWSRTEGLK